MLNTNDLPLHGIKYSYQIQIILKQIYLTHRLDEQVLPLQVKIDLRVMIMKYYTTFSTTGAFSFSLIVR